MIELRPVTHADYARLHSGIAWESFDAFLDRNERHKATALQVSTVAHDGRELGILELNPVEGRADEVFLGCNLFPNIGAEFAEAWLDAITTAVEEAWEGGWRIVWLLVMDEHFRRVWFSIGAMSGGFADYRLADGTMIKAEWIGLHRSLWFGEDESVWANAKEV